MAKQPEYVTKKDLEVAKKELKAFVKKSLSKAAGNKKAPVAKKAEPKPAAKRAKKVK